MDLLEVIKSYECLKSHGIIQSVDSFSKVVVENNDVLRSLSMLKHQEGEVQSIDHVYVRPQEDIVQGKSTILNPNPNNRLDEKQRVSKILIGDTKKQKYFLREL